MLFKSVPLETVHFPSPPRPQLQKCALAKGHISSMVSVFLMSSRDLGLHVNGVVGDD